MLLSANIYSIVILFMFWSCGASKSSTSSENDQLGKETELNTKKEWDIAYITGRFAPESHPEFSVIPANYRDEDVRYLRSDVLAAFIKMYDAAYRDGIKLIIKSATRNFDNQKRIWENKWTGKTLLEDKVNAALDIKDDVLRAKKILEYSSMPGTSRHHWGTDIDLNAFENEWFESVEGARLYAWLTNHAHRYGFCQPYTKMGSDRNTGYFEEKWHWTYTPVSAQITRQAEEKLKDELISGFLGSETAVQIKIVQNYVLGISPVCRQIKN